MRPTNHSRAVRRDACRIPISISLRNRTLSPFCLQLLLCALPYHMHTHKTRWLSKRITIKRQTSNITRCHQAPSPGKTTLPFWWRGCGGKALTLAQNRRYLVQTATNSVVDHTPRFARRRPSRTMIDLIIHQEMRDILRRSVRSTYLQSTYCHVNDATPYRQAAVSTARVISVRLLDTDLHMALCTSRLLLAQDYLYSSACTYPSVCL